MCKDCPVVYECRGPGPCGIQVQGVLNPVVYKCRGPEPSVEFKCREFRTQSYTSTGVQSLLWYSSAGVQSPEYF